MRILCACIAVAVCVAAVLADDGNWVVKTPQGSPGSMGAWASVASTGAYMWVCGGDGQASNGTYLYNWLTNTWTLVGQMPWYASNFVGSDMVYAGGSIFMVGGAVSGFGSNSIWVRSGTQVTGNGWNLVPAPTNAPSPRSGHSVNFINGYLVITGGWDTHQYFAGVWAYDLTQLTQPITGWSSTTWIPLVPDASTAATSPSARNGQSVVNYEGRLIMFGGFYHNAAANPSVSPQQCAANKTLACTWFQDVWVWEPTLPISNTAWALVPARNGVVPPARFGHAAGVVNGNTMIVFGGSGANGPLNDIWSYDISLQLWRQLSPTGTAPPASNTPIGATIGRHFLLYTGLAPGNVYVYYPPDPSAPSPSGKPVVTCDGTHLGGVNAGIVITILLCIATLVFAVWNWRMLRGSSKAAAMPGKDIYSAMDM